ncbi:hypothetical protein PI95_028040 [Hassallia byssoidea VB512170]|uniref:Uncharacterized protein n=1 Tax=Hassallia byssoidea VB512170 TaxID=1304833 RepID=A0A846HG25_9CYAN|nr:hypothetical protein [Hassalia byssoidea]NEU76275.1 hypothetical protein [Hassalia byssoidea VB512170]
MYENPRIIKPAELGIENYNNRSLCLILLRVLLMTKPPAFTLVAFR